MKKVIVILGPTATGKTNLALKLCQKFNGEIISVDSRQAYKEMNIGTGKIIKVDDIKLPASLLRSNEAEGEDIPTHLYDLVVPSERLNAFDYSRLAWEKIEEIRSRKKIPFLVGGTGFYLDVILGRRKLPGVGVNQKLRVELEKMSVQDLIEKLRQLDPDKLKMIDVKNKYRIIRAIEIISSSSHAELGSASETLKRVQGDIVLISLTAENTYLYRRADERVDLMIKSGLVGEVKRLVEKYGWQAPGLNSLGYCELKPYFDGLIQLNIAVEKIKFNTHAYIRRQKTYFKKYYDKAHWFDVGQDGFEERAQSEVELYLR